MKKNPYSACPHDFTTGRWRVHLVFPGESRADGIPRGSKKGNPPCADTMVEFYDTEDNGTSTALKRMDSLIHSARKPRPIGLSAMTLRR